MTTPPHPQPDAASLPDDSAISSVAAPLAGLRVLDFSRLLPGPLCTLHLADMGADVLKVENPRTGGDYARSLPPLEDHQSYLFNRLNRHKRSVALDWTTPEGLEAAMRLAEGADVLIESFRPGLMTRQGLGWEVLRQHNPRLVYCSLTGYGQTGPLAHHPGHDINYLAYSGLLDQTGTRQGPPAIPAVQVADILGGSLTALAAILAAVIAQQRTGQGQYLDVAMLDGLLASAPIALSTLLAMGQSLPRGQDLLTGAMPFYDVYETADGRWMALGALEFKFWERFCQAVARPDWVAKHYVFGDEATALRAEVASLFRGKTQAEWTALLEPAQCCCTPVLTLAEALEHPQVQSRGQVVGVGPSRQVGFPVPMAGLRTLPASAPSLGTHNAEWC
jgi:crotonobetainyl-CoA:carnitine CoA-transferase CaiB-like acyl-CoA transferase